MTVISKIKINNQLRGTFLVAISGMLYGIMAYFGTQLFQQHLSVENMLFWRFLIASFWMMGFIFFSTKKIAKPDLSRSAIMKMMIFGAITYSGASAFYFMACEYIGTGVAMVIFFSYPIFVTLFAWCLSQWKMNKTAFLSLVFVIIGLIFLKGNGKAELNLFGIGLGMIAAIFYAVYIYGSQHTSKSLDSRLLTLLICLGNCAIFLVFSLYNHTFVLPTSSAVWINIFALGILATALPIQLLLDGLKYISPIKASILSVLEPVVTVLVGIALLHETISSQQSIGMIVIIIGALLIQFERAPE